MISSAFFLYVAASVAGEKSSDFSCYAYSSVVRYLQRKDKREGELFVKRLLAIISIVIITLMSFVAFATEAKDVEWGMSQDDVCSIYGDNYISLQSGTFAAEIDSIAYLDQTLSKFDDFSFIFLFVENTLIAKEYALFGEITTDRYNYLENALIKNMEITGRIMKLFANIRRYGDMIFLMTKLLKI